MNEIANVCELVGADVEALDARPEPDVHRRRILGLDAADPLERLRDRHSTALEQKLACEQRAVQLPL
jgi:hypothetical protein